MSGDTKQYPGYLRGLVSAASRPGWRGATVFLAILCAPLLLGRHIDLAILGLLHASMALGLLLVVGYCRLFDLGFAGFVCLGAYSTGVLMTRWDWPWLLAVGAALLIAAFAGILLGTPTLRLRGDYFAIVTFGFSEVVVLTVRNWTPITGGAGGLGGIPSPYLLGLELPRYPPTAFFFLAVAMVFVCFCVPYILRRTQLGAQMIAVGDDETLAGLVGIDVVGVKLSAFAISAALGGLTGSFWAVYFKFLDYPDFSLALSVQVIAIVIVAGELSLASVVVAAAFLAPMSELLRRWFGSTGIPPSSRFILYGLLLVAVAWSKSPGGRRFLARQQGRWKAFHNTVRERAQDLTREPHANDQR